MKKILVIVDMQNDFINGALGTKEAQKIVPNVIKKINENEYDKIYVTQDTHYEDYLETQEGKKLPIEHCIDDTDGWKINKEIKENLNNKNVKYYKKPTFGSVDLWDDFYFRFGKRRKDVQIELIGLCTDICVLSNAIGLKATLPEAQIIVDASCCAGSTPENNKTALQAMKCCQIEIINE